MNELYVVIDVGCLECEIGTSVLGVFTNQMEAREIAAGRIREKDEDVPLEVPSEPFDLPSNPDTLLARAECWDGQSSVEVHRVSG